MAYDVAVTDDNLTARPEEYPGRAVPGSGLLHDGRFVPVADVDAALRGHGVPDLAARTAVLAIGSNACAAVVLRKLGSVGVDTSVPFMTGVAAGISVGHSAHRSVTGFIPAAPSPTAGSRNTFIINMFSDEQLAAIDGTEPNYRRITVGCEVPGRAAAELYVSRWGLLAPPGGSVLPLMSQPALFDLLTEECLGFDSAREKTSAHGIAHLFIEQGWARDPGLR